MNQIPRFIHPDFLKRVLVCALILVLPLTWSACKNKAAEGSTSTEAAAVANPTGTPAAPQVPKIRKPILSYLFGWTSIWQKIFPPKAKPPTAQPVQLIGTIRQVNLDNQFVLIDTMTNFSAAPGEVFVTLSKQTQTATLRMSPLKSPPFLIADITDGKPSPGDRVFRQ